MKTYIINSIKKIKFHKKNIDIKQFICDKPWLAFNELGEEELYIFLPSGIMVISRHGNVTNASWKYINANKTIIITTPNGSVMVHPAYYDDLVIALQKDRTDEYAILINENNKDKFKPQNIIDVNNYFDNKCLNDSNRDIKIEYSNKKRHCPKFCVNGNYVQRDNYSLIVLRYQNYFSFVVPSREEKFPLYSPIFPKLVISNGIHIYIDNYTIE